ncbi:PilZ domain-containing protein [Pontibacter sp. JAM-7]|uniref:PilZ domain-containing protein n=1 Tax=Pontibacter sp. JAM-7 TaxID=3366581 RepID=UPI003AF88B9C
MSTLEANRRRFTRIHFDAKTEIMQGGIDYPVTLIDISFKGVLVSAENQLPVAPGDQVSVTIHVLGDDLTIQAPLTLKHQHDSRYGFVLGQLDLDSLTLLRRIVELNLGEEALLERELEQLIQD